MRLLDTEPIEILYTNHAGETRLRKILPNRGGLWFGSTPYHNGRQWFIRATDLEDGKPKDFALKDFHGDMVQVNG